MLQRRRCRCCVSGIFILVISISVFYFSSKMTGISTDSGGYVVDVAKTYPDFRKYAKNIGETLDGVGWILADKAHAPSYSREDLDGNKVPNNNPLQGITMRLLMDTDGDTGIMYSPTKLKISNTTIKSVSSQGKLIHNVPNSQNATSGRVVILSDMSKEIIQEVGKKEGSKGEDEGSKVNEEESKVKEEGSKVKDQTESLKAEDAQTERRSDTLSQDLGKKPTQIIIVTNRRSGSSFLGQIFNQNPDIFFHYEPLKLTEWKSELYPNATSLLQNILKCRFNSTPFLMDLYGRELLHRESSKVLISPPLCDLTKIESVYKPVKRCPPLDTQVVTDVCKKYTHTVIKLIRMYSLSSLEDVVRDPEVNVKVLHLVRDPRGIYISRAKAEGKPLAVGEELEKDVSYTCRRLRRNLEFLETKPDWLQGRYKRVRYEELAQDPIEWAQRLYDFAELGPVPRHVKDWIQVNTHGALQADTPGTQGDAYSTQRNSSSTAQGWRKNVPLDVVQHMQELCRPLLGNLGYLDVSTETELLDESHSLVV